MGGAVKSQFMKSTWIFLKNHHVLPVCRTYLYSLASSDIRFRFKYSLAIRPPFVFHVVVTRSLDLTAFPPQMNKGKRERNLLAFTGAAALAVVALNVAISAVNARRRRKKMKDLPGSSVKINLSAAEITALTDEIIAKSKETHDLVASIPLEKVTYANTISPLAELEARQFPLVQSCLFPKMVSSSDDVRGASAEAEKKLDSYFLSSRKREDVYRIIKAFLDRGEWLSPEAKRFIECLVRDFERNGVCLNLSKRTELQSLRSQIDNLSLQYIENLNKDSTFLLLNESELLGMPIEFIKNLEKSDNGKLKVPLRSSHVSPILEYCKVGATRKVVAQRHGHRCGKDNLVILENLIQLRHRFAQLLGYSSYADYAIEPRMAKSSAKVFELLEDTSRNLTDLATRELQLLKHLKQKEEGESTFGTADMLYYMKRAEEQYIDTDFGVSKKKFPADLVVSAILKTFGDLFGLKFDEIENFEVWHDTVRLFSASDLSSSELLGYFYLDMFPREGKYTHTCVLALQNGCLFSNGARQVPIALLLSQFSKQNDDNRGLLKFSEVITLFHEFGHVVHQLCNRASFSRFSGLRLEPDFIEIPSLMLENWCYENSFLELISIADQDSTKAVGREVASMLKKRRDAFCGLKLKQEILLCLIDQIIHSSENVDIVELVKHLYPKVMLGIPLLDETNPTSCSPYLAIGHEASCYSYLWSEVIAADIFQLKFQDDLRSQYAGLQFRNKVLAPGGASDPLEIVVDYLGREPSVLAFIENRTRNSLGYYCL